jgi:GH15 family glucan-1,4-alpha-glucosidase
VISTELINAAWRELKKSVIYYRGEPIGTVAARDSNSKDLNYNQCFTRDFAVSALAFLMRGETDVVRNFLTVLVELQSIENHMKCFKAGRGLTHI